MQRERAAQQRRDLARAEKLRKERESRREAREAREAAEERQLAAVERALGGALCDRCGDKGFVASDDQGQAPALPTPPLPDGISGQWLRIVRCPDCDGAAAGTATAERWSTTYTGRFAHIPSRWTVIGKPVRAPGVAVDFSELEARVLAAPAAAVVPTSKPARKR